MYGICSIKNFTLVSVFFIFAIIAFKGIGRTLVFLRFLAIIAFEGIGQDIGSFRFFAIIAF